MSEKSSAGVQLKVLAPSALGAEAATVVQVVPLLSDSSILTVLPAEVEFHVMGVANPLLTICPWTGAVTLSARSTMEKGAETPETEG